MTADSIEVGTEQNETTPNKHQEQVPDPLEAHNEDEVEVPAVDRVGRVEDEDEHSRAMRMQLPSTKRH